MTEDLVVLPEFPPLRVAVPPQGVSGGSRGGPGPEPAAVRVVFLESVLENFWSTLTDILTVGRPGGTHESRGREGALLEE